MTVASLPLRADAAPSKESSRSGPKNRVIVLPLKVEGSVPARVRAQFQQASVEGLHSPFVEVVVARDCLDTDCASKRAEKGQSNFILVQRLQARERNYQLQVDLLEAQSRRVVATSSESCDLCGVGEVKNLFSARAAVVRDKIKSLEDLDYNLTVKSSPAGAEVYCDGRRVGVSPQRMLLTPGNHTLEVRNKGFVTARRVIKVVTGVQEILDIDLVPVPEAPQPQKLKPEELPTDRPRAISLRGWGWLSLGVGILATGAGASLLALHRRPFRGNCKGDNVDVNGNCRFLYDTKKPGIGATAGGALLTLTGATLLVVTRKNKKKGSSKRASLYLGPTEAALRMSF